MQAKARATRHTADRYWNARKQMRFCTAICSVFLLFVAFFVYFFVHCCFGSTMLTSWVLLYVAASVCMLYTMRRLYITHMLICAINALMCRIVWVWWVIWWHDERSRKRNEQTNKRMGEKNNQCTPIHYICTIQFHAKLPVVGGGGGVRCRRLYCWSLCFNIFCTCVCFTEWQSPKSSIATSRPQLADR